MKRTLSIAALVALAGSAHAQVHTWNGGGSGVWNLDANWNPVSVPDAAGESAVLGANVSPYIVTLSVLDPTVDALDLTSANAQLDIQGGSLLSVDSGGIDNDGAIVINSNGSAADAVVTYLVSAQLDGSGVLFLNGAFFDSQLNTAVGAVITQGSAHTIEGRGTMNAALVNNGIVDANVAANAMALRTEDKTNNATMRATNAAFLDIFDGITITQGVSGVILADESTVRFASGQDSSVVGGTLSTIGAGEIQRVGGGTTTLDAVTNLGLLNVLGGGVIDVPNGITNNGLIVNNSNSSSADGIVNFSGSGMLTGSGTLTMNRPFADSQLNTTGGAVITQASTHTIEGIGSINAALVNNGLVTANLNLQRLELQTENKTNNATMRATAGGILEIDDVTITQGAGGILLADNGVVEFVTGSSGVVGGTLDTASAGIVRTISGAIVLLDAVANQGDLDQNGGAEIQIQNNLTNNGTITNNDNSSSADGIITILDSSTLSGTGTLVMNRPFFDSQLNTAAGQTMTNASTHTIEGRGYINASMINNGLVTANFAASALHLRTETKVNNATMSATNTALLDLEENVTIDQSGGGQLLADNGTVRFPGGQGATVIGGTLETINGGQFLRAASALPATLDGVTNNGAFNQNGGGLIDVLNGLVNDGVIVVNDNASSADGIMTFLDSSALSGSGTVVMNRPFADSQLNTAAGQTMTHAAGHTIEGRGYINASMINNGLVTANIATSALHLRTETKVNNATMSATNTAFLDLEENVTIDQSGGGQLLADNATVRFPSGQGATVIGGTLETINGGQFLRVASALPATLDGVTNNADFNVNGGGLLDVTANGLVNNGTIILNVNSSSADGVLTATDDASITGNGTVVLNRPFGDSQIGAAPTFTLTNGPDHTIRGIGTVFGDVVNQGRIEPGLSAGQLDHSGGFEQTASGTLAIELGGTGSSQFDQYDITGDATLAGTVEASIINGYVPANNDSFIFLTTANRTGFFDTLDAPNITPLKMKLIHRDTEVELRIACFPDVTTAGTMPGDPGYGDPDGQITAADIQFYVNLFVANDPAADLTTTGAASGDPGFGEPDGNVTAADIQFYVNIFISGCP